MFDMDDPHMTADEMTIREMCDAFAVTPRTLRFYEQKELLFPARIGQKRLFSKRDRARLKLILRGKRFGFSLEEIRQLLDLYYVGAPSISRATACKTWSVNAPNLTWPSTT
jgi:DNA-binding transcriptional MerR regulator